MYKQLYSYSNLITFVVIINVFNKIQVDGKALLLNHTLCTAVRSAISATAGLFVKVLLLVPFLCRRHVVKRSLKLSPHSKYVATLPCVNDACVCSIVGSDAQRAASPTEANPAQFDVIVKQVHVNGRL